MYGRDLQTSPFTRSLLQGRTAVITGGGSGIGFEITRQLGLHGCNVVIMGRRKKFLEDAVQALTQQGVQASFKAGDVRSSQSAAAVIQHAVDTYGGVDILVNSAAGNFLAAAEHLSPKGFKTVVEIDTIGTYNMSIAAFPHLKASTFGGNIINITATLHYGATWYQVHPSAAKAAIDAMTRSLALEWGTYKIRVNGIAPGPIAGTAGLTKLSGGMDSSALEELVASTIPIQRMGTKFDIAMATLFICSDAGSNISGTVLVSDGGACLYKPPPVPREVVSALARKVENKSRDVGGARLPAKL